MALTPFDILYQKLIELVNDKNLVRAGNFIEYDGAKSRPEKPGILSADVPEIVLYMSNVRGNLHQSSSTVRLTTVWRFVQSSGTYDSLISNAVNWGLLQIAVDWKNNGLRDLVFKTRPFMQDIRLNTADSGQTEEARQRNIRGWVTIADFEIDCSFLTEDVVAAL